MFPWAVLPTETTKRPGSIAKADVKWETILSPCCHGEKRTMPSILAERFLIRTGSKVMENCFGEIMLEIPHMKSMRHLKMLYITLDMECFFVMKFRSCPIKCWDSMGNSCGLLLGNGFVYTIGWPWISPKCILMIHQVVSPNMLDLNPERNWGN